MNAWLEDLSEDWVSQEGGSSSPQNASNRPDSRASGGVQTSDFGNGTKLGQRQQSARSVRETSQRRGPLSERSESSENELRQSATSQIVHKATRLSLSSRSLSASSSHSVVAYGTVARKSTSMSPPKSRGHDTPEWRRRLLGGQAGFGDQKELFGPSGLEKMFQKPPTVKSNHRKEGSRGLSFLKTIESIPSSPPPWPTDPETNLSSSKRASLAAAARLNLASLEEEDDEQQRGPPLDSPRSVHRGPDNAVEISSKGVESLSEICDSFVCPADAGSNPIPPVMETAASRALSGQSFASSDFSPVFISKHNTADGRVDYAALDMSRTQLENHLRDWKESQASTRAVSEDNTVHAQSHDESSLSRLQSEVLPDDLPAGTPELEGLGEFVNIRRGGLSNDGSFMKKPLSPSPLRRRTSITIDGDSAIQPEPSGFDSVVVLRPAAPSPPGPFKSSFLHPERPTNLNRTKSGNPLRLFEDHDTYTANKLHRRISQLEDTVPHVVVSNPTLGTTDDSEIYDASRNAASSAEYQSNALDECTEANHLSRFGDGALDDHSFPVDDSSDPVESAPCSEDSLLSRSPPLNVFPPGAQQPFKFRVQSTSSNEPADTFRGKRKLSKLSAKNTLSIGKRSDRVFRVQSQSELQQGWTESERVVTEGKRPPTSPNKIPTPKRRRTLVAADTSQREDDCSVLSVCESSRRMQSVLQRKRKDSRNYGISNRADPETLARRHILRPRNPTPSQRRTKKMEEEEDLDMSQTSLTDSPQLEAIHEDLPTPDEFDDSSDLEKARVLAGEVAAFSEKVAHGMKDHGRKRSVTTQDFLDEAMKIMSFIRAKGHPNSALGSLEESELETPEANDHLLPEPVEYSRLTVSRPPSRDGSEENAWRPRQKELDPRVIDHLRKYQETNDDINFSFGHSMLSPQQRQLMNDAVIKETTLESDPPGVRIISPSTQSNQSRRRHDLEETEQSHPSSRTNDSRKTESSGLNTTHSHQSTESSIGRTVSSRPSDFVGTIAPDAVEHLLHGDVAGMRFDKDKGIWIRSPKKPIAKINPQRLHAEPSRLSQNPSEDDPFNNIPDLTVDDSLEKVQLRQPSSENFPPSALHGFRESMRTPEPRPTRPRLLDYESSEGFPPPAPGSSSRDTPANLATFVDEESPIQISTRLQAQVQSVLEDEWEFEEEVEHEIQIHEDRPMVHQTPSVASVKVSLSSTTLSRAPQSETPNVHQEDNSVNGSDKENETPLQDRQKTVQAQRQPQSLHKAALQNATTRQRMVQIQQPSPSTRNASLVLSTPSSNHQRLHLAVSVSNRLELPVTLAAKQSQSQAIVEVPSPKQSSPYRADVTFYLSELPDFTVNQVDERELPERPLVTRFDNAVIHRGFQLCADESQQEDRFAGGNHLLVQALQDVTSAEPYWENLRKLQLQKRSLTSLNLLDLFCDRLEQLDASDNAVAQLAGAPPSLRSLNISSNRLTNLTSWAHLPNLQYLDVSNNGLDNLSAFESLVHLRELKADANNISALHGITKLDGLIKLSLRNNRIQAIDFADMDLARITHLDLSDNELNRVDGLSSLPELRELCLNGNQLVEFPTSANETCYELQCLALNGNRLSSIRLAKFAPDLRTLSLDNNRLSSTGDLSALSNLESLSLRSQNALVSRQNGESSPPQSFVIEALPDVLSLNLSDNHLPHFTPPHDFPSLRWLELASCGLQSLPDDFGNSVPNLRALNVNFNNLRDLKPLAGARRLRKLFTSGNQLTRMRKNVAVLAALPQLEIVDMRDNTLTHGFYSYAPSSSSLAVRVSSDGPQSVELYSLPPRDRAADAQHSTRLDEATQLRRRVYELLLASACKKLKEVDGLPFNEDLTEAEKVQGRVVDKLVEMGVCRKVKPEHSLSLVRASEAAIVGGD